MPFFYRCRTMSARPHILCAEVPHNFLAGPLSPNQCHPMNFPQFWARGQSGDFFSWRWSSTSADEAQRLADESARQLEERFRAGDPPPHHRLYYPGRPFREQILREIRNDSGELIGVVTRNSYGCLVLNTPRVMFVDVDLPEPKAPSVGLFKKLFGKPEPAPPQNNPRDAAIAKAEAWGRNNPDWSWRIYRTRAGLRLLATHALFDPETSASNGVFDAVGADPLYRQLCKAQKCFRARLTPKPWRCGVLNKPQRWPWLTPKDEARFQKWEKQYQLESSGWATCELLHKTGNGEIHPDVHQIIRFHDEATRAESRMNLA
jgi:hypothetical protein